MVPENTTVTMTSIEIADLCEKRHDNVMADIKNMLEQLETPALSFQGSYIGGNRRELPCFNLPRDLTMTLITGYSIPLRKKVIDRWMELEGQGNRSNVTFLVPKSLPEALRLAADLADKVEEQKAVIGALEPKANFHDAVTSAVNCQTVQEAAKLIGTGQNRLFKKLRESKLLMADNQPYQSAIEAGYFRMVEGQYKDKRGESHTYTRTLVTGKGLAYIQKHFGSAA
ncbi:phage regulatory protein/antirepressor Ant [Rhizobium sp. S163]|uniref:phage regulatory protein/antirepressor Ant n=1 Tax=Rhizobium sp. S163 TaxID=3055039 RepID=UPI0025A9AAA3|nr:phage regulatory protein/antirepressor Ant [Rhizobium sp. S163]MDM9643853.1 phage regulatory protein/antirepressor Ant [Rhizobium sp. S163]